MAMSKFRFVQSYPCPVHWQGWQTTTTQLQQGGWSLSAEEDFSRGRVRLAMRNDRLSMGGISQAMDWDYFARDPRHGGYQSFDGLSVNIKHGPNVPEFHIISMFTRAIFQSFDANVSHLAGFQPIDAMPQMVTREEISIDDFRIFATPLTRTEEIIVEPATVASLLEQIKSMQAAGQAEIRKRNRWQEGQTFGSIGPQEVFHAQILSFPSR